MAFYGNYKSSFPFFCGIHTMFRQESTNFCTSILEFVCFLCNLTTLQVTIQMTTKCHTKRPVFAFISLCRALLFSYKCLVDSAYD